MGANNQCHSEDEPCAFGAASEKIERLYVVTISHNGEPVCELSNVKESALRSWPNIGRGLPLDGR